MFGRRWVFVSVDFLQRERIYTNKLYKSKTMELIKLDTRKCGIEISEELKNEALAANELLHAGKGKGSDFLGWITLPSDIDAAHLEAINAQAAALKAKADVIICIGIGGSYLGAKAVIDAMTNSFELLHKEHKNPIVLFAGQNISEDYLGEMLEALKDYSIATIVASKSGTTTEPAIAFRILKEEIERRYGKEDAKERIVAITDKARGALKTLANKYLSAYAKNEAVLWTDGILEKRASEIHPIFRPIVAYKLLFDIAENDSEAAWKCFLVSSDMTVEYIAGGLAQNNDREFAAAILQLKRTKPVNMKQTRDFLVGNKKYIKKQMVRYVTNNIERF